MSRRRSMHGIQTPMEQFKVEVMRKEGYQVDQAHPENVKYEVAKDLNIPLKQGYNGELTTEQAGKIGGKIGGQMVKELIRQAQENLVKQSPRQ